MFHEISFIRCLRLVSLLAPRTCFSHTVKQHHQHLLRFHLCTCSVSLDGILLDHIFFYSPFSICSLSSHQSDICKLNQVQDVTIMFLVSTWQLFYIYWWGVSRQHFFLHSSYRLSYYLSIVFCRLSHTTSSVFSWATYWQLFGVWSWVSTASWSCGSSNLPSSWPSCTSGSPLWLSEEEPKRSWSQSLSPFPVFLVAFVPGFRWMSLGSLNLRKPLRMVKVDQIIKWIKESWCLQTSFCKCGKFIHENLYFLLNYRYIDMLVSKTITAERKLIQCNML